MRLLALFNYQYDDMKETLKISVSGVRGVVGDSFSPQLAASFAQAFGAFVGQGDVMIARDTRKSGAMIEQAVVAGLMSVGCTPVCAGIAPTPSVLFSVKEMGFRGGIMITASHNAAPWNALKFIDRRGMFLNEVHAEELFDLYHQQDFPLVAESDLREVEGLDNAVEAHFRRILDYVDANRINAAGLRVAVDCCNGVGALYSEDFLSNELGCEVISVFDGISGEFEREPEPLPENLEALSRAVTENWCHIGFAQDPDGDRLAVVDEKGEPIGENRTVALAVQQVLKVHEQGPIVINMSASKCIERAARDLGFDVIRSKTGEINVSEAMIEAGAVVGGEHTGGIIIPAVHPCRDSFAGMAVILELLAMSGLTVSELTGGLQQYQLVKDKIPIRSEWASAIMRDVRRRYEGQKMNFTDGVHIDMGDRWVHIRRSDTEPVLRIIAEAPDMEGAEKLIDELRSRVKNAVQKVSGRKQN